MHYTRWQRHGDPLVTKFIYGDDEARFESQVDRSGGPDACHLWTGAKDDRGYGVINIGGKTRRAHQFAWELHSDSGLIPAGTEIDHECHNRAIRKGECRTGGCAHCSCCNWRHLAPKSRQQHAADTEPYEHPRGTENGQSRLTPQQVREIRTMISGGVPPLQIARIFGVSRPAVHHIKSGRTWKWLEL